MKRSVLSMAEENYDFSVHDGNVTFSTERIEFVFVRDEERSGSFEIFCQSETPALGICYSSNPRMRVINAQFRGNDNVIEFVFDSSGMEPGDVSEGEFIILCNKGEYSLPFACVRDAEFVYSSLGHIKNLFHFANLAMSNWDEAVNVFYSNAFLSVLNGQDAQYKSLYRGLSENVLNERNVDEFLVAVKKKNRMTYSVSCSEISVVNPKAEMTKPIALKKSSWGYISIDVKSEGNFLYLPQTHFCDTDFSGDLCEIPVTIMPNFLSNGRNFGKVYITTPVNELEVTYIIDKERKDVTRLESFMFRQSLAKLLHLYIDLTFDRISKEEWSTTCLDIAEKINGTREHNVLGKLFSAQILLVSNRKEDAAWLINQVREEIESEQYSNETYGYYLYISSLLSREADYVAKALKKIKKFYSKDSSNSIYAWLILYLTEDFYKRNDRKLEFLIEQFREGNNSPLLYIEGLSILNTDPSLLMKLDDYEEAVLKFGYKYKAISPSLGERVTFLVSREKEFKKIWFDILKYQYSYMPSKELLNVIVNYLCRGNKISNEYFEWYRLGVNAELRITRLYEFFMDSVSLDYDEDLPQMVMMYFAYQNDLDYRKKAFLYHNVLTRKNKYPEIAVSYRENLENFAKSQIVDKHINKDLLYIYAKVMNPQFVTEDIANECVSLQFVREIKVPDEQYIKVILIHDKIVGEQKFLPENGTVYCPIYSKDFRLFYEDENGNRIVVPDENISGPILNNPMLLERISYMVPDKIGLIMCRVEGEYAYETINERNVFDYEKLLDSNVVTYSYKKIIIKNLLDYYFENDYVAELEDLLQKVKPEIFAGNEKSRFIQILAARGMYDTAFEIMDCFGTEHIEDKNVLRLVSRLLERTDFEENEKMISYAQYIYRKGKYDANVLSYLSQYFQGNSKELRCLFKDSEEFGIDTFALLENILVQMLFTNVYSGEKLKFLNKYIANNGSLGIIKAFLSHSSYDYFVLDSITDDDVFDTIEKLLEDNEDINRICKLALIKYYSSGDEASWNTQIITDIVNEEIDKRVCFPFFMEFEKIVPKLQSFTDFSFVEYKGKASGHVVIHYCIEHEDGTDTEYKKEEMNHLYGGIFVKPFILFCGDMVQYYITEENDNMEQLTESSVVQKNESVSYSKPWRYTALNDCIVSKEMGDYVTVENDLLAYMEKDYLTKELFKIF